MNGSNNLKFFSFLKQSNSIEELFEKYNKECEKKEEERKKKAAEQSKKRKHNNDTKKTKNKNTKKTKTVESNVTENGYVLAKEIESFIDLENDNNLINTGYFYNIKDRFLNTYLDRDFMLENDDSSDIDDDDDNVSQNSTYKSDSDDSKEINDLIFDDEIDDYNLSSKIVSGKRNRKPVDRSFEMNYWKQLIEEDDELLTNSSDENESEIEEKDYGIEEEEEEEDEESNTENTDNNDKEYIEGELNQNKSENDQVNISSNESIECK